MRLCNVECRSQFGASVWLFFKQTIKESCIFTFNNSAGKSQKCYISDKSWICRKTVHCWGLWCVKRNNDTHAPDSIINGVFCNTCSASLSFPDDKNPCHLDEAPGPCRGLLTRYFFDSGSQQCKHFFYGGCFGNANNFRSMAECQAKCLNPGRPGWTFVLPQWRDWQTPKLSRQPHY